MSKTGKLYVSLNDFDKEKGVAEGDYGWKGNQSLLGDVRVELEDGSAEVVLEPKNEDLDALTHHLNEHPTYHPYDKESDEKSFVTKSLSMVSKEPEIPETDQDLRAYVDITLNHQNRDSEYAF